MSYYVQPQYEHDPDPLEGRTTLIQGGQTLHDITEKVCTPIENPHKAWWIFFLVSASMLGMFVISIAWLLWEGVGIWGHMVPVAWAWPIVNFVFWVGIGHAGTLISAILFLFRQKWRTSINRAAEAMTIFAVICALMFPTIHIGRVWVIYWALPLPNQMTMWPNFRSPLLWDVFAVSTYFTVSLLFWYVGMIPDLATMRDRAKTRIRQIAYGIFALGWRGSHRHWVNYESAYLLLAAMATPLVLSVHSIVSFDFAVSQLPGWHTTIFPPYFVAGAIFSGFGMVLTLLIPLRVWFGLEDIITIKHLENMGKIILLTGCIVGYAYAMEFFIAWYSGNPLETFAFVNRAFGPYWWAYLIMVSCNVITPQFIWFKKIRRSPMALFILSIFVNIGMWFERFVIVVSSLANDFLPSSWDYFRPTFWDFTTLIGSFGLFFTLFCLFVRFLPSIAMTEAKAVMAIANPHYQGAHAPVGTGQGAKTPTRGQSTPGHGQSGVMDSAHDHDEPVESETSVPGAKKVVVAGMDAIVPAKTGPDAKDLDDDGPTKVERRQEMPVEAKAPKLDAPKLEVPKDELVAPKLEVPKLEVPKLDVPKLDVPKLEIPKFEPPPPLEPEKQKADAKPDSKESRSGPEGREDQPAGEGGDKE